MQKIAIIGGGPSGIMAGITALQNTDKDLDITIFDKHQPLKTLLYTGGGRCNLSYAEYDSRRLVKFYPRGEKFLLSPFVKFGVKNTQEFFFKLGVDTYIQDDNRIFPTSDNAEDVRYALLDEARNLGIKFEKLEIESIKKIGDKFLIFDGNEKFEFDKVVISTGGNRLKPKFSGYKFAKSLGHSITELRPILCGLETKENLCQKLSGLTIKNLNAKVIFNGKMIQKIKGDLLFTHKGISGPLAYKTSSYCAYCDFNKQNPLTLEINFTGKPLNIFDKEFAQKINQNQKKNLFNIIIEYLPRSMTELLMKELNFNLDKKAGSLIKNERVKLSKILTEFQLHITRANLSEAIVTAGGVDLKEINGKTMESKIIKGLYFCGEILDVDGLTGGFNLQACWSTGYIAGSSL